MKTAEEWQEKLLKVECMKENEHWLIQQIQLDAYKAGMTKAAEIVVKRGNCQLSEGAKTHYFVTAHDITNQRDSLTELPL